MLEASIFLSSSLIDGWNTNSTVSPRFSDEALGAIVGMETDVNVPRIPAAGNDPEVPARTDRLQLKPLDNGNFIPEAAAGVALALVEKINVFLTNQVVKTFEKVGAATARYMALLHKSVPDKKYQPVKYKLNQANWYRPKTSKDVTRTQNDRSNKLNTYGAHLSEANNNRFVATSSICGFPFSYDVLIAFMNERKDLLEGRFFPPNTNFDIHITLKDDLSQALRCLGADETEDQAARVALRNAKPSFIIDDFVLFTDQVIFPEGHRFIKSMEELRRTTPALIFPLTSNNEIRDSIVAQQTDHRFRLNLHQLQFPAYLMIFFMRQQNLDGSNGYNLNLGVHRFPPNLDSLDVTYANNSLLPTGKRVTRLSSARIDTLEKLVLCQHQAKYREDPDALGDFYSAEAVQQYLVLPLQHLYANKTPAEWSSMSPIFVELGFTSDLSPPGWQIVVTSVSEGQLGYRRDNSHYMVNSTGAKIDGA